MTVHSCSTTTAAEAGNVHTCALRAALGSQACIEGHDAFCRIALTLCRFIGAAYATGASDCWEAAHRFAEEAPGVQDGPLLVARVAALVRTLRSNGPCELCFMPPSCRRLSKDEAELMRSLALARSRLPDDGCPGENDRAMRAITALARC